MQVKKFEAKTMKEALEMVKAHMGPDAIILTARDHSRGFGLVGEKSVEVTAAVSEEALRKKQLAEQKLNVGAKEQYQRTSARSQKEFIDRYFEGYKKKQVEKARSITSRPYIEIIDEEENGAELGGDRAQQRIRSASQRAWEAIQGMEEPTAPRRPPSSAKEKEVLALRKEVQKLKGIIESFSKVPQSFISRHPGAEHGLVYELSPVFEKLRKAGLSTENVVEVLLKAQNTLPLAQVRKRPFVEAWVARYILDHVHVREGGARERIQVFMGPLAQGKTSSLVKMASHMVICEKKSIAIVSADSHKVGAAEQLKIYSQILNVPFALVKKADDWSKILEKLDHVDHILVDMPGSNLRSIEETERLKSLIPPANESRCVHYVQSVLAKDEDAQAIAKRYQGALPMDDLILTGLDETIRHGFIYNIHKSLNLPLHSFGIGPQIPEDLEVATRERIVDLIFKITKVKKLAGVKL